MANTWSALAPVNFMPKVQRYVNQRLVAKAIARTEFRAQLVSGQSIDWPTTTDMRVQDYTPGTDLTIDNNAGASDTMLIDQSKASTWTLDPNQQRQAEDKTVNDKLASQAAFVIAQQIDQAILKEGVDFAGQSLAGGSLTASDFYEKLTEGMALLQRANLDLDPFAVLDPERVALLAQIDTANGFNRADSALQNGFVGNTSAGFRVFRSNNLPTSQTLTVSVLPTATDTMTVGGVVWTFVAIGTAAAAGEISLGASAAATQVNIVDAINGTGTPGAGTYIEVSVNDRRKLQNGVFLCSAFAADVATITAAGKQNNSETFTSGSNVFGTETGSLLLGGMGAVSLGMQIMPTMASAKEPARPMERNFAVHTLYGKKVFARDVDLLVDFTINV